MAENEDEKIKEQIKPKIGTLTPDQLSKVQELLGNWKTQDSESSQQMMQKNSSIQNGAMLVQCQTERSSSKKGVRYNSSSGPDGI